MVSNESSRLFSDQRKVLIYFDEGVGPHYFRKLQSRMRALFPRKGALQRISAQELREGGWEKNCRLLIFPGGRDVPYHQCLSGEGTSRIRNFVEEGGKYLGICAGAYFGAENIRFAEGHAMEITAKRDLAFFPGAAVGPAYGPGSFSYENNEGARLVPLLWPNGQQGCAHYYGGCFFEEKDLPKSGGIEVLARYQDLPKQDPAIVSCSVGKGRAILCGLHPEATPPSLEAQPSLLEHLLDHLLS